MISDDKLLVKELLSRIRDYQERINDLEDEVQVWHDAYYDIKAEYEPITQQMPYYDTAVLPSPTLDNLVDLKKKLKGADTVGC